jgi:PhnB protein
MKLEVYLYFKGNCKEAMEFYKSIFGGELKLTTYGKSGDNYSKYNAEKDWIMHCELKGGDISLMASDGSAASEKAAKVELSLTGTDETKMKKVFEKLSDDAQIHIPLEKQMWGDIYGRWTDKFGIIWSMNIGKNS